MIKSDLSVPFTVLHVLYSLPSVLLSFAVASVIFLHVFTFLLHISRLPFNSLIGATVSSALEQK